jgi:hypothetical protein
MIRGAPEVLMAAYGEERKLSYAVTRIRERVRREGGKGMKERNKQLIFLVIFDRSCSGYGIMGNS